MLPTCIQMESIQMKSDISLDETMFIIGSGPCLNKIDIKKLKGLNTISLNRQYIAYEDWGFWPKYHLCIDAKLIRKIYVADVLPLMNNQECEIEMFFILSTGASLPEFIEDEPKLIMVYPSQDAEWKPEVITKFEACYINRELAVKRHPAATCFDFDFNHLKRGSNLHFHGLSGAFATGLSHALGYKRVVLLGIDAKYDARRISVSAGKDLNHFHPDYFDVKEFIHGEHFGSAKGYYAPWTVIANKNRLSHGPAASSDHDQRAHDGAHSARESDEPDDEHRCNDELCGVIYGPHLCSDTTFEVISCSPGSIINEIFEYIDLEELLKSCDTSHEN
jgi:hypothetical protein